MTQPPRVAPVKDRFYARTFALVTCLVLGLALFKIVQPFLGPLLWAIFIAFLLYPLHVRLAARLRGKPQWSAALLTVLTFVVIIGPLTALSAAFAAQVGDLLQIVQDKVAGQTTGNVLNLANVPWVRQGLNWLNNTLDIDLAQLQSWITQGSKETLQTLASLTGKAFIGAIGTVVGFVLMQFMLFFFIRDGGEMVQTARELIPMAEAHKAKLFDHLAAVTRAMVYGTGMTALIQGALVGIAFLIANLPSPIVFGVIAALFALLPFGGTALVWGPAAVVLAVQGRWGWAIFMLAWGAILVSLVDNVVRPMLVSGRANVGTLTVFIGVLGGLAAFGAIGLFLGPVVLALIIALIRFRLEMRRAEVAAKALSAE
ncbi:AI-2E family transporter [Peristeroidobacter agariperforans]|uniref:AI-2E family transporter n=1 Tax=Peristeroidobacter agariperforans TaxID=268404 RepID=UPI00101DCB1E|nr:AI-2E family transporter [Peristeroidobacter agariperforans]